MMRTRVVTLVLGAVALLTAQVTAGGPPAYESFLQISGIAGQSQNPRYRGWIQARSVDYRIPQLPSPSELLTSQPAQGRGRVQVGDIVIVKQVDSASPQLKQACTSGKHFAEVTLQFVRAGRDEPAYLQLSMRNVRITNVGAAGAVGGLSQESVSLNFSDAEWTYTPQQPGSGGKGAMPTPWWMPTAKPK